MVTHDELDAPGDAGAQIGSALVDLIAQIPATSEPANATPHARARAIASAAALQASAVSGTLALPPAPLGLITILPELAAVWRIQAQMVADIAGAFDKSAFLSREHMLYCLFKHSAAQAVRDLVVRVGERYLVRHASLRLIQTAARKIGVHVSQRAVARTVGRWLPVVGALGVAGYAYYDTVQVAQTTIALFEREIEALTAPNPAG
jgi:hypothetical protein